MLIVLHENPEKNIFADFAIFVKKSRGVCVWHGISHERSAAMTSGFFVKLWGGVRISFINTLLFHSTCRSAQTNGENGSI